MPAFAAEILPFVEPLPLGLVIQSYGVEPGGSIGPLLYWDFKGERWVKEYTPECLLRATREAESGCDAKSQNLPIPLAPLATPGVVAKVYFLGPDGERTEVRESFSRLQPAYLAGANA